MPTDCTCLSEQSVAPNVLADELLRFIQNYESGAKKKNKREALLREAIVGSVGGGKTPLYKLGRIRICQNGLRQFVATNMLQPSFLLQSPKVTLRMPKVRKLFSAVASALANVDDRVSSSIPWKAVLSKYCTGNEVDDKIDKVQSLYRRHLQCCMERIVIVSHYRNPCQELLRALSATAFPATGDALRFVTSVLQVRVANQRYDRVSLTRNLRYHAPAHGDGGLSFFVHLGVSKKKLQELIPVVNGFDAELRAALARLLGRESFSCKYQVGYMFTEYTQAQRAHVDFTWKQLNDYKDELFIGFFPLTSEGTFLQIWTSDFVGRLVFIPYGWFLIVPATTVHGGGFRSGECGNPRCHMYIYVGSAGCNIEHKNTYMTNTEPKDRQVLSNLYQDCEAVHHMFHSIFN